MDPRNPAPNLEHLLQHAGWVRALARQLISDPELAEDVVQDAWLAALRNPPAENTARAWLRRVVGNLVGTRLKGESLRHWHESQRTRERQEESDSLAADLDLERELELQAQLAGLVQDLPEPHRTSLLQRYYQGLSSSEVARREGISSATVRSRVKRGIEALQRALDESTGGDRDQWQRAFLPICAPTASLPSSVLTKTLAGVLTMGTSLKVGVAAVAALCLVLFVRSNRTTPFPEGPEVAPRETARAAAPLAVKGALAPQKPASNEGARQELVETAPATIPTELSGRLVVRMHLVDGNRMPLDRVDVTATLGQTSRSTASDSAGRVELELPRGGAEQAISFQLRRDGLVCRRFTREAPRDEILDVGQLEMTRTARARGRVVDAQGQPIAGARVLVVPAHRDRASNYSRDALPLHMGCEGPMETDADGRFESGQIPPGYQRFLAQAPGTAVAGCTPIEVDAGGLHEDLQIVLGPLPDQPDVRGRILLPDGSPAKDARLAFLPSNRGALAYGFSPRAKGGQFAFDHVTDTNGPLKLLAWSPRGLAAIDEFHNIDPGEGAEIWLQPAPHVELQVTVQGGEALPRFRAVIFDQELDLEYVRTESRSKDARVTLQLLRPSRRPFLVSVEAEGYGRQEFGPFTGGNSPGTLPVVLRPLPRLEGKWLDGTAGVSRARVAAYRVDGTFRDKAIAGLPVLRAASPASIDRTGKDGAFSLTLEEPGRYVVRAEHKSHAPVESAPFHFDGIQAPAPLELLVAPGCVIEGEVIPPPGGSRAGHLVAITRGDHGPQTTRTDGEGRFRFENLIAGPWSVTLHDRDVPRRKWTILEGDGHLERAWRDADHELPISCDISPQRPGWVQLRAEPAVECRVEGFLERDGEAVRPWRVLLFPVAPDGTIQWGRPQATSTRDGRFELKPGKPGPYHLRMQGTGDDGHSYVIYDRIEVTPGTLHYECRWQSGKLEVHIPEALRADLDLFYLVWNGPGERYGMELVQLDGAGQFDAGFLPAGDWKLQAPTKEQVTDLPNEWRSLGEFRVEAGERGRFEAR